MIRYFLHAAIHALNEWMYETWQFDYEGRIFSTPVITLPIVDKAIEELEWVHERGAKVVLIRPAPVPGFRGTRSFALPEFDPFWKRVVELDILVALHSSDSGYDQIANWWEGSDQEMLPFKPAAFRMLSSWRPIEDAIASLVAHGALAALPGAQDRRRRERRVVDRAPPAGDEGHVQEDAAGLPRRAGGRDASQRLHQPVLGRGLRPPRPTCSARTTSCSAPTTRTPRASSTRSAFANDLAHHGRELVRKFMGGNLAKLMNVENTPVVPAPATV